MHVHLRLCKDVNDGKCDTQYNIIRPATAELILDFYNLNVFLPDEQCCHCQHEYGDKELPEKFIVDEFRYQLRRFVHKCNFRKIYTINNIKCHSMFEEFGIPNGFVI